jgi:CRP/FNR family transcriptional regulator
MHSLWGPRMVGVHQEAILYLKSASALFGGKKQFVQAGVELGEFAKLAVRRNFDAKSTIIAENEPSAAVYVITHGTARLYKMLGDGRRQIVGFALPSDFLGLSVSDRHSCSVDAISQVAACKFPREPFLAFLQASPKSLYLMLQASLRETNVAREHMLLLGRGTAEEKVAEFIISWRARVGRGNVLSNLVPLPMSRNDIADYFHEAKSRVGRAARAISQSVQISAHVSSWRH